jgi:hypothetical protein
MIVKTILLILFIIILTVIPLSNMKLPIKIASFIIMLIMLIVTILYTGNSKANAKEKEKKKNKSYDEFEKENLPVVKEREKYKLYYTSGKDHHTYKYKFDNNDVAVVRRGQDFEFVLTNINMNDKNIIVSLSQGPITIKSIKDDTLTLTTSVKAPLSKVTLTIINNSNMTIYTNMTIYVIFNPYHKDDEVYMNKKDKNGVDLLDEYIQRENGLIFTGSTAFPEIWHFSHFEENTFTHLMDSILSYKNISGSPGYSTDIPDSPDLSSPQSMARFLTWYVGNFVISGSWPSPEEGNGNSSQTYIDDYYSEGGPGPKNFSGNAPIWPNNWKEKKGKRFKCNVDEDCRGDNAPFKGDAKKFNRFCNVGNTGRNVCAINYNGSNIYRTSIECDNAGDTDNWTEKGKKKCTDAKIKKDAYDNDNIDQDEYDLIVQGVQKNNAMCIPEISQDGYCGYSSNLWWHNNATEIFAYRTINDKLFDRQFALKNIPKEFKMYGIDWYKNSAKFGQCWIIAVSLLTACRSIGIPARQISNRNSNHNSDFCDNEDNDPTCADGMANFPAVVENAPYWNFHSWNDVWMKRPDLKADGKYDGWQGLDSTIQEVSVGISRMGPAPLKAVQERATIDAKVLDNVKDGYFKTVSDIESSFQDTKTVAINYDVAFLNHEVNWFAYNKLDGGGYQVDNTGGGNIVSVVPNLNLADEHLKKMIDWNNNVDNPYDDELYTQHLDSDYKPLHDTNMLFKIANTKSTTPLTMLWNKVNGNIIIKWQSGSTGNALININVKSMRYNGIVIKNLETKNINTQASKGYNTTIYKPSISVKDSKYFKVYVTINLPTGKLIKQSIWITLYPVKLTVNSDKTITNGQTRKVTLYMVNDTKENMTNVSLDAINKQLSLNFSKVISVIAPGKTFNMSFNVKGSFDKYRTDNILLTVGLRYDENKVKTHGSHVFITKK